VDPESRRRFWDLIHTLGAEGVSVLVSTHYMDEAEYCHRIALISGGRLIALGTPREIKRQGRAAGAGEPSMEDSFVSLVERAATARQEEGP
jgi:ABC-2 type transport system ATP-binding protein